MSKATAVLLWVVAASMSEAATLITDRLNKISHLSLVQCTWLKLWDEAAALADDPEAPKPPRPPPNDCDEAPALAAE